MQNTSHIIQKQTIEINFENIDNAIGVQNQIRDVFYEKLQPQMQALFDDMFGENYYTSLDTLEIDCGILNQKNWEQEFIEQAIRKLKKELLQVNKKKSDEINPDEEIAKETFFFFLIKGFLPWNKRFDTIAEIEQHLQLDKNLISELKKHIVEHKNVAERLVYQFSKSLIEKIIIAVTKDKKKDLEEITSLLEKVPDVRLDKRIVDVGLLKAFASDESINRKQDILSFLLTKTDSNTKLQPEIAVKTNELVDENDNRLKKDKQQSDSVKNNDKQTADELYISNAGLVLLHPFLPILYKELMLAKENQWINEYTTHKAVLVLQYLVSGKDTGEECDVMLNKVLCGVKINEVLITEPEIDEKTKAECDLLLRNVITHWSILKNTSIEGLRETFLQRNGKLSKVDNGWLLQVEQKTVDILLNHLPWGIGLIKLPWMKDTLHVEWV